MLISLNGVPGTGKTVSAVSRALKHYRQENTMLQRFFRKRRGEDPIKNSIYSNVPILLDRKRSVYSNIISIYDLDNSVSLLSNSLVIIDEAQAYHDSFRDFRDFPRAISSFLQFHRHFGVKDIIVIAQSPNRLIAYERDVCSYYHRIKRFYRIPLIHLGIIYYRRVPEFDNYYQSFTRDKDSMRMYDISGHFYFFNYKRVFRSYRTDYMRPLNSDRPLISHGTYESLAMSDAMKQALQEHLFVDKRPPRVPRASFGDGSHTLNSNHNVSKIEVKGQA